MESTLQEFSDFLLVKKGIRQITIDGYQGAAKRMMRRLGTRKPTPEQIYDYMAWFHRQNYSYSHIHNTVLALEWYMNFIGNPIKLGRQKKPRTIVKNTLSEAEVTRLLMHCKNIREKAILSLLAYSGVRNRELCSLKVNDVDMGNNTVRVLKGKGVKDRLIYFSSDCTRILLEYLRLYLRSEEDYLFTTLQRNECYTGYALRKLVKVVTRRAGFTRRIYPHLLRHTLATNMMHRGADIWTVKNQLGHVFVESTMIYLQSMPYGTQTDYSKYAPSYL